MSGSKVTTTTNSNSFVDLEELIYKREWSQEICQPLARLTTIISLVVHSSIYVEACANRYNQFDSRYDDSEECEIIHLHSPRMNLWMQPSQGPGSGWVRFILSKWQQLTRLSLALRATQIAFTHEQEGHKRDL